MIRARYPRAQHHLISLMPHVVHLQVYDNSTEAAIGAAVPDPVLVFELTRGRLTWPSIHDPDALARTPDWAKALVEAALRLETRRRPKRR